MAQEFYVLAVLQRQNRRPFLNHPDGMILTVTKAAAAINRIEVNTFFFPDMLPCGQIRFDNADTLDPEYQGMRVISQNRERISCRKRSTRNCSKNAKQFFLPEITKRTHCLKVLSFSSHSYRFS